MTADLKPYPAMKDSGVPWLGEVPKHWDTSKIKGLARPGYKTFVDGDWIESPYITADGIRLIQTGNIGTGEYREKGFRYISEETFTNFGCTEIKPGDVLICRLGEPVARACLAPQLGNRMITSVDVCILKTRENIHAKFLVYSMSSWPYLDWVGSLVRGSTRDRVSRSMLGSFLLPFSPLPEQFAIVRYLDHVDRRIRRYIHAKQKLVKLLEEQKQALIHQAVTRGLDPNVRLKPSGAEWLGDVPEHWQMVPNRALMRLKKELVGSKSAEYLLLSLTKRGVVARDMENPEGKFPAQFDSYQVIEPGDLIFCLFDIDETPRAVGLSSLHGMITGAYTRVVCADENARRFAYLLYMALDNGKHLKPLYTGLRKVITKSTFLSAKMPLPSPPEQAAIIRFLDEAAANIDDTINRNRRQIDLLREYRTRLIADVVTGKLDVRSAAARLPDEVEEPEPLDETDALIDGDEEPADDLDTTPEEATV